jgi:hypothetical protein
MTTKARQSSARSDKPGKKPQPRSGSKMTGRVGARGDLKKGATKLERLEAALRSPEGATISALSKSLAWQAHSVRGAISGTLKKKRGLTISSAAAEGGERIYRIVT